MGRGFTFGLVAALTLFSCSERLMAEYIPMPTKNSFFTGNDFYRWCEGGVATRGLAQGYAAGVWDAVAPTEGKAKPEVVNIMAALKQSMEAKGRGKVRDAVRRRMGEPAKEEEARPTASRHNKARAGRRIKQAGYSSAGPC